MIVAGADATTAQPAPAQLAARAIATWADIECQLGGILTTMLGANAAPAAAMFYALTSSNAQMASLDAAAETVMGANSRELDLFDVILERTTVAAVHRNRFAHWVWAHTPDLRDAILFVDPEAVVKYDMSSRVLVAPHDGRVLDKRIDFSRVLVYREKEMKEAVTLLSEASYCLGYFRMMTLHLSKPDEVVLRDRIYQHLSVQPWIAEALGRLDARRKSDPKARPSRRRR